MPLVVSVKEWQGYPYDFLSMGCSKWTYFSTPVTIQCRHSFRLCFLSNFFPNCITCLSFNSYFTTFFLLLKYSIVLYDDLNTLVKSLPITVTILYDFDMIPYEINPQIPHLRKHSLIHSLTNLRCKNHHSLSINTPHKTFCH